MSSFEIGSAVDGIDPKCLLRVTFAGYSPLLSKIRIETKKIRQMFDQAAELFSYDKKETTMKKKFAAVLAAVMAASMLVNPSAKGFGIEINIGDRPYYDGPYYWEDGFQWVWVPGYRYHDHWVHGHYERRGEWRREHAHERHEHHHHDDDRR